MSSRIEGRMNMKRVNFLIVCSLLLTACAQMPQPAEPLQALAQAEPGPKPELKPAVEAQQPEAALPNEPALPNIALSNDLLYEYLLSEIAIQRGHLALALETSLDIAKHTRDPRLARRAAQLSFESGDMNKAIEAFKLWQEVEPGSQLASRMLASILLRGGKLDEARLELARVLQTDKANLGVNFMQIFQLISPYPDKRAALQLMRELAEPYPMLAEAHWSVAQLALQAGDEALALSEARQAQSLRPEWDLAVLLQVQLLQKNSPLQALALLSDYLAKYPDARDIRLQYARMLLEQKQLEPSRLQFQRLAQDSPDNPDLAFAIALISLQLNDLQGAEHSCCRR
jgi:Flp pilus assembly protein TadD